MSLDIVLPMKGKWDMLNRVAIFAVCCTIATDAWAAPEIIAVFDINDKSGKFSSKAQRQLTDYFAAKLAEGNKFRVVPRSQLKAQIIENKKKSMKSCYDEKCQIDIGRELAAQKSLATKIIRVGTKCAVMSTMFDLKSAASVGAASAKAVCDQDSLVEALEVVAHQLKNPGSVPTAAPVITAPEPKPEPKTPPVENVGAEQAKPADQTQPKEEPAAAPSKPVYKKWWFWTIIGVAVAATVGLVVWAALEPADDYSGEERCQKKKSEEY